MRSEATIDLRSDTFTLPSKAMYDALRNAGLGDDVYAEDPTVKALEMKAAALTGKETALLVTSGTQGNLSALMSHTERGDEVLLGRCSDVYNWETGGVSAIAGLYPRSLDDEQGWILPDDVDTAVRPKDVHFGRTRVLVIENTHQRSGGTPVPISVLGELRDVATSHNMLVHMDGARLFNAATALGKDAAEIAQFADSVSFCLSKGLSCPVGSLLCGGFQFIERARWVRKMLGGGMRQAGWIAAAGLVALDQGIDRLGEDHARAKYLAERLSMVSGLTVNIAATQTNIVVVEVEPPNEIANFRAYLEKYGVFCFGMGPRRLRMVVHRMIGDDDIEHVIETAQRALSGPESTKPLIDQDRQGADLPYD